MITLIQVYTSNLRKMEHDKNMFTTQTLASFSNQQDKKYCECQSKIQTYFFICKICDELLGLGAWVGQSQMDQWAKVKGPSWIQTNSFRKKEKKNKSSEIAKIAKDIRVGCEMLIPTILQCFLKWEQHPIAWILLKRVACLSMRAKIPPMLFWKLSKSDPISENTYFYKWVPECARRFLVSLVCVFC